MFSIVTFFTLANILFVAGSPTHEPSTPKLSATLPITRRVVRPRLQKRQGSLSGAIGLGDTRDVTYSIEVTINSVTIPLVFDTGSSDLWSITTDCTSQTCGSSSTFVPRISASSFQSTNIDIEMNYGDSQHRTSAIGVIGQGTVEIAGMTANGQFIAAINKANTTQFGKGQSGIFGVGFPNPPSGSVIFEKLINTRRSSSSRTPGPTPIDSIFTDAMISALPSQGPFLSRMAANGQLKQPMFTVTLERESIEVGGNVGQLTIGQLPDGVSNDTLTWVPVRLYSQKQGGLPGSSNNPNEAYPALWEIPIDDVLLNGMTLPKPTLQNGIGYTALVDSGTSFLAGPKDTVSSIYNAIAPSGSSSSSNPPTISCTTPVDLTFVIGGKKFPVDPRDFLSTQTNPKKCVASSVLPTDPPAPGSLISWILGDPFMKSNLVAFYYGNLTHPSADPPRIGFLSTVPADAKDRFVADVKSAQNAGGFVTAAVLPPQTTFPAASTNSLGVGQAPTAVPVSSKKNRGFNTHIPSFILTVAAALISAFLL